MHAHAQSPVVKWKLCERAMYVAFLSHDVVHDAAHNYGSTQRGLPLCMLDG